MQNLVRDEGAIGSDPSGNPILKDIGAHIRDEIRKVEFFKVRLRILGWQ